jgi:hypothetical protein
VEDDRPPPPGEPLVGRHHPQIERLERLDERVESRFTASVSSARIG